MEKGGDPTHLLVTRTSTVDSTTSTNTSSSFDDGLLDLGIDPCPEVRCERSPVNQRSLPPSPCSPRGGTTGNGGRRPSGGLRETRIIISQDGEGAPRGSAEEEGEMHSCRRADSLHKLHQQHALDSWDHDDSASSSSRSSSISRMSPRPSPSPSHRLHHHPPPRPPYSRTTSTPTNVNSSISLMCLGSTVLKVKRQGKTSSKMLFLDSSRTYIRWKPSKKGHKARVNIKNIRDIREGALTDTFKKHLVSTAGHHPAHCFSVIHGTSWESLDIVAGSLDEAKAWVSGLRYLTEKAQEETAQSDQLRDSWLKSVFESADKSGDGLLSMDEVLKLLHKLNVNLSKRKVKQLFREADSNIDEHLGKLDFDEFVHFYKTLSMRPELYALLREYSYGKEHMTLEDLELFLKNEQGLSETDEKMCAELILRYEPVPENIGNNWLGIDGLMRFVLGDEGNLFNPDHRKVNQDMTQPLSHYYIASSHNTYLLGDQLMSQSSVDVYGLVLQAGCRCVELDTWDGKDGEPVIYHGYTLTTKVKFRDVITVVNKYAFVSSPYPVILSIENHCTLEQQKKMARYLLEILGDQLIIDSPDMAENSLPSPESLKGKILIKAKKLPLDHDVDLEAGEVSEEDSADELDDDFKLEKTETRNKFESIAMAQLALMKKKPISPSQQAWQRIAHKRLDRLRVLLEEAEIRERNSENKSSRNGRTSLTGTFRKLKSRRRARLQHSSESENSSMEFDRSSSRDDDLEAGTNENHPDHRKHRTASNNRKRSFVLSRQLSDLVKVTRSVAFKGFPENMPWWELPSLGEMRANNLAATRAAEFANFTIHNLCRVYPSAYRIDSSNFNPQPMWNCGCQLVALNYQTEGRAMQLLRAKFRANGSCGYVLKPPILRQDRVPFDPTASSPVPNVQRKQLTFHIISGQQLPKPPQSLLGERGEIIDPYVEVEVVGLNGDCIKAQTKTVQDNGFNPVWDCILTFPISLPELTLVRFVVWDEDPIGRDFIGQATFPFSSICEGYRHIHLEGLDHATVFVHVTIEDLNEKKYVKNSRSIRSTSITRTTSSPNRHRTKSMEAEVSLLMGGGSPVHQASSPRRRTSLAERLGIRRRHSTTTLLVEGIMAKSGGSSGIRSPTSPTATPTFGILRQKRRSYEGERRKNKSQGEELADDMLVEEDLDSCPVDCEAVMERIMSSDVAFELEADGSISVPLDDIPCILHLGISPSQILQVIQDGRLSIRSAILGNADSVQGDLWDNDSGLAISYEGCENDSEVGHLVQDDPDAFPACCGAMEEVDGSKVKGDMTSEMDAMLSAQLSKDKPEWGEELAKDFPSTEDCSSCESIEDILVRAHSSSDVLEGMLDDLSSLSGARSSCHEDNHQVLVTYEASEDNVSSLGQGDVLCQDNRSSTSDVSNVVICQQTMSDNVPLPHSNQPNDGPFVDLDAPKNKSCIENEGCHEENEYAATPVQGLCKPLVVGGNADASLFENNRVLAIGDQLAARPATADSKEHHQSSLNDDCKRRDMEEQKGNANGADNCSSSFDIDKPSHCGSRKDMEEQKGNANGADNRVSLQGQNEDPHDPIGDTIDQSDCQTVHERKGRPGTLSCVFNSLLDLAASLAQEEMDLETSETTSKLDQDMIQELTNMAESASERNGDLERHNVTADDSFPDRIAAEELDVVNPAQLATPSDHSAYNIPSSSEFDFTNPGGCQSQPVHIAEESEKLHTRNESTANVLDGFVAHSTPLPDKKPKLSTREGSPIAPPRKVKSKLPLSKGHSFDSSLTSSGNISHEKESKRSLYRPKSLVKLFTGFLHKSDMDAKQSDTRNKGFRASLKRKFMNRSVPDIRKIISKEEEPEKTDNVTNALGESTMMRASSIHDIRIENVPNLDKDDELHDIKEESRTPLISSVFNSPADCMADVNSNSLKEVSGTNLVNPNASPPTPLQELDCSDVSQSSMRHDELDDILVSYMESPKVDSSTQTDLTSSSVSTPVQEAKRPVRGDWHRDGNLSRPLSCPILPRESNKNLTRIVYFQEQPLCGPDTPTSSFHDSDLGSPARNVHEQIAFKNNGVSHNSSQESVDGSYDSIDSEEFSSHICVVEGCGCAVSDISTLLDSALLTETCFNGEEFETGNEAPANQDDIGFDDDSETIGKPEGADSDTTSDANDDLQDELTGLEDCAEPAQCPEKACEDGISAANGNLAYMHTESEKVAEIMAHPEKADKKISSSDIDGLQDEHVRPEGGADTMCCPENDGGDTLSVTNEDLELELVGPEEDPETNGLLENAGTDITNDVNEGLDNVLVGPEDAAESIGQTKDVHTDITSDTNEGLQNEVEAPTSYVEAVGLLDNTDIDIASDANIDLQDDHLGPEENAEAIECEKKAVTDTASDVTEYDSNGNAVSTPEVTRVSSVHTHLESSRRSRGMFRSEYNRSFDEDDSEDDNEQLNRQPSPQKTETPVVCDSKESALDLANLAMDIASAYAKPEKDLDNSFEDRGSENRSSASTLSMISSCAEESVYADVEISKIVEEQIKCKDSEVVPEVSAVAEVQTLNKGDNIRSPDTISLCFSPLLSPDATSSCYSPMLSDTETETSSVCAVIDAPLSAEKIKDGRRDSSYDIVNALDELSSVLDDELCLGKNEGKNSCQPASFIFPPVPPKRSSRKTKPPQSTSLVSSPTPVNPTASHQTVSLPPHTKKAQPDLPIKQNARDVGNASSAMAMVPRSDPKQEIPSAPPISCGTKHPVPPKRKVVPLKTIKSGCVTTKPPIGNGVSSRPLIGSAISVKFLGQLPRQMSAYCYSDSDSDYDSTTSGSSQETVVEALAALPSIMPRVKPPVPPKSSKLKLHVAKQQFPGQKPPVPPKPQHLKTLPLGKTFIDLSYKDSLPSYTIAQDSQEIEQCLQQRNKHVVCANGNVFATNIPSDVNWTKANRSIVTLYDDTAQGLVKPNERQELSQGLRETIGARYNVTMRNRSSRERPRLEHRHSTGSMFSLANLPDLEEPSAGILVDDHTSCSRREYPSDWGYSQGSLTVGRKKRSHQRVYFMLNV